MTITESGLGLAILDRDYLEESLSERREELRTALRFYNEIRLSPAPRAALSESTRAAIVDIDAALAMMHKAGYGVCEQCRRPLPIRSLTLRPLELLCRDCELPAPRRRVTTHAGYAQADSLVPDVPPASGWWK